MRMNGSEVSLYFHIPFCTRKCDYCHFYVLPEQEPAKEQLLEGLQQELALIEPFFKDKQVISLYFGGGTPSLFGPSRIASILNHVKERFTLSNCREITLEVNPENVTLELMRAYAQAGINRVSIGIQTLDAELLALLGRLHSPEIALNAIHSTYRAGIDNISIDLMYDLPKQTLSHWERTLQQIQTLPISHLSLYNLTIEPHTVFFKNQHQLRPWLPMEEVSLKMYEMAIDYLENINLHQYEISAFAKSGCESLHNTGYWTGRPFWGLGPSAFSYWQEKRFRNVSHLGKYCQAVKAGHLPIDFEELLDKQAKRRELFVIQLRLKQGVPLNTFTQNYGALDQETQNTIDRLIVDGLLYRNQDHLLLTKQGILFYDTVAAELI